MKQTLTSDTTFAGYKAVRASISKIKNKGLKNNKR